jgi:hypothetical protein
VTLQEWRGTPVADAEGHRVGQAVLCPACGSIEAKVLCAYCGEWVDILTIRDVATQDGRTISGVLHCSQCDQPLQHELASSAATE